jgi:hypothetical protein
MALMAYGSQIQSFQDIMKLTSIAQTDIAIVLKKLGINTRYLGPKAKVMESNLNQVHKVDRERYGQMVQRMPFFPDLLLSPLSE